MFSKLVRKLHFNIVIIIYNGIGIRILLKSLKSINRAGPQTGLPMDIHLQINMQNYLQIG